MPTIEEQLCEDLRSRVEPFDLIGVFAAQPECPLIRAAELNFRDVELVTWPTARVGGIRSNARHYLADLRVPPEELVPLLACVVRLAGSHAYVGLAFATDERTPGVHLGPHGDVFGVSVSSREDSVTFSSGLALGRVLRGLGLYSLSHQPGWVVAWKPATEPLADGLSHPGL